MFKSALPKKQDRTQSPCSALRATKRVEECPALGGAQRKRKNNETSADGGRFPRSRSALLGGPVSPKPAQPGPKPPAPPAPKPTAAAPPIDLAIQNWTGDLDGMIKRRRIRVLTMLQDALLHRQGPTARDHTTRSRSSKRSSTRNSRPGSCRCTSCSCRLAGRARPGARGRPRRHRVRLDRRHTGTAKIVDFAVPSNTGVSEIVVTGPKSPSSPRSTIWPAGGRSPRQRLP